MYPFVDLTANINSKGPVYHEDKYDSAQPLNGAQNPLGIRTQFIDSKGREIYYKYVRLNATVFPTLAVGPVYWKDNTFQVVTPVFTEGFNSANMVAGVLLNIGLTNGNFTWIVTCGFCGAGSDTGWGAAIMSPGGAGIGDAVIGATGASQAVALVASP